MTESLNYILKKIGFAYLMSNKQSLKNGDFLCPKDVRLPCNCIPGIIVNFSAFLTMLFLGEDAYEARLELSGNNGYIRCCKGTDKLFPIESQEKNGQPYVLKDLICLKSEGEHAYVPFPPYSELNEIADYLKDAVTVLPRYPSDSVCLELTIRLLSAMRTRPLCQSSRAFLFMTAYLRPKRTLRLMYDAREEIGKEWLREFMLAYVTFLQDIANDAPLGFKQRLNASFRKAVGFDIAAFLEDLDLNPRVGKLYEEVLISAYNANLTDLSRQRASSNRICMYISDAQINKIVASLAQRHLRPAAKLNAPT